MIPKNFVMDNSRRDTMSLVGKTFDRLTCVSVAGYVEESNAKKRTCYLFKCSCGNQTVKRGKDVQIGKTKSCGCLHSETSKKQGLGNTKEKTDSPAFIRYYKQYKSNATRRGLEFSLEEDLFRKITSSECYYCSKKPEKKYAEGWGGYSLPYICNGIDRKDNNKGYTPDNSAACCSKCNHAKHTMSEKEYIEMCLDVAKKFSENQF